MLKSYFKIAIRSLKRNRLTTFINIFGLGLSMSVGMMIMIRMQDELGYDHFHPHPERTYRVTSSYQKKGGEQWKMASTPLPLNEALAADTTIIESAVNVYPAFNGKASVEGKEMYVAGAYTEPSFFKVLGFSLKSGNPETALQMPNTVVINNTTAEKFFGTSNPIGKVITMENGTNFIITGILNDAPGKSHLKFDAYASYSSVTQLERVGMLPGKSNDWYAFNSGYTYILLKKGGVSTSLQEALMGISNRMNVENKDGVTGFNLQPIEKITPSNEELFNSIGGGGNWAKIYFELGFAFIILLAACFNYTNLTIARSLTRAKEVGVRKIVGARRFQVFTQYLVESILLSLLALGFGWILLSFIIHYAPFNDDYEFIPSTFHYNGALIFWSIAFALFTGILAGTSPAWILSSFKPLRVLKNLSTSKIMGKISLQKALIVFQYCLSLTIIIFLVAFYRQFSFMSSENPGFQKDNVLVVPLNGVNENIALQKIGSLSGVKSVAGMSATFDKHFNGFNAPAWRGNKKETLSLNYYYADQQFIPSMGLKIIAGSNFPKSSKNESESYIIVNEKAAAALGFKDYSKALGEKLWINDSTQLEIAGILKDFNYESAGKPVAPLAFRNKKNACNYLYVTTGEAGKKSVEARIKNTWKTFASAQPFSASWLNQDLDKSNSQSATISLLGYLAFIAVAIASLGLLGLVIYTVEVKRKEIGIRKIIGAGENQIVLLLSKGFIKLLFIAGLIAMPLGYIAGFLFLQNFAHRITFRPGTALLCFLFLLAIGLITIISQTYKAAMANPVTSLRSE
jgi:putative ABC transport system permease protein